MDGWLDFRQGAAITFSPNPLPILTSLTMTLIFSSVCEGALKIEMVLRNFWLGKELRMCFKLFENSRLKEMAV